MTKKTDVTSTEGAAPNPTQAPKKTPAKPVKTDNSKNGYLASRRAARRKAK
ncbi:hypothetical protein [uncultured Gilvimarinus sp.]|uniref:hypothetical protein n=1 Tax=uncultured Gilvimarinus sp. TaxID=1689143 RepID=UPI0030DA3FF6